MKPKILHYGSKISFLAIMKNGYIVDIACSDKDAGIYSETHPLSNDSRMNPFSENSGWLDIFEVQARDLVLYTHWPQHTKEFWDLLNET